MRRLAWIAGLFVVCACSGPKISDSCPSPAVTGSGSSCVLTAQCVSTHTGVKLDCSAGDGNCICSENGVDGKTVSFQSSFCGSDTASDLESANSACGWNL